MGVLTYVLVWWSSRVRPPYLATYIRFQALFWMTAPAALLYGIPWERLCDPATAAKINLWTLALVAIWRGVCMVRIIQVLSGKGVFSSFACALTPAYPVAFLAFTLSPPTNSMFAVMAGVRYSPAEEVVSSALLVGAMLVVYSAPVVLLIMLCVLVVRSGEWTRWGGLPRTLSVPWGRTAVLVAAMAAPFAIALPRTQAEQRRVAEFSVLIAQRRIPEALKLLSAGERGEGWPPGWEPPPRSAVNVPDPSALNVYEVALTQPGVAEWVKDHYLTVVERQYLHGGWRVNTNENEILRLVERLRNVMSQTERGRGMLRDIDFDYFLQHLSTQPTPSATQGSDK